MAWETRGKARYFYRSRWVEGRSVKSYCGRGPVGLLAQQIDEQDRRRREAEAEAFRAEVTRLAPAEAAAQALDAACGLMTEATLMAAGCHRVNYEWRRRRARSRH